MLFNQKPVKLSTELFDHLGRERGRLGNAREGEYKSKHLGANKKMRMESAGGGIAYISGAGYALL